jgi:hypothetical protein
VVLPSRSGCRVPPLKRCTLPILEWARKHLNCTALCSCPVLIQEEALIGPRSHSRYPLPIPPPERPLDGDFNCGGDWVLDTRERWGFGVELRQFHERKRGFCDREGSGSGKFLAVMIPLPVYETSFYDIDPRCVGLNRPRPVGVGLRQPLNEPSERGEHSVT